MQCKLSYAVKDTNYEKGKVKYAAQFSWDGKKFEKRPGENEVLSYRKKRSDEEMFKPQKSKGTELSKAGIYIIVQNISIIDQYLVGSARSPFSFPRRLFMINIMVSDEPDFDDLTKKLLEKLWITYAIGNAAIITPCDNKRQVCSQKNIFEL